MSEWVSLPPFEAPAPYGWFARVYHSQTKHQVATDGRTVEEAEARLRDWLASSDAERVAAEQRAKAGGGA